MKKPLLLVITLAALLLGILAWRHLSSESQPARMDGPSERAASAPVRTAVNTPGAGGSASAAPSTTSKGGEVSRGEETREERLARLIAEADSEIANVDVPIQFWGRVVDETDGPVPDVSVNYEIAAYVPGGRGRMTSSGGKVSSDATGRFTISGVRGHELTVKQLQKTGYFAVGLDGRVFSYAQLSTQNGEIFRPDASHPVIYKMMQGGTGQPLQSYEFRADLPTDGTVQRSSTGNGVLDRPFRLQFTHGDSVDPKKSHYDWTFVIQIEGGVIQRSIDEFVFLAPADGYFEKLEIVMETTNPNWKQAADVAFFVRTAGGKFGRFTVHVAGPLFADEPRARMTLQGTINPSGSRNLSPPAPPAPPPPLR